MCIKVWGSERTEKFIKQKDTNMYSKIWEEILGFKYMFK